MIEGIEASMRPRGRLRRFLRVLGRLFVAYVMASIALSFIPEGRLNVEFLGKPERVRLSGELLAGAARSVISPPRELWDRLNLYGEGGPIEGIADDVCARALTLGVKGSVDFVSIVSVEMLVIPPAMRPALEKELAARKLARVRVLLNATHTHAGCGNFWDVPFGRFFMGKYDAEYFRFIVGRVADAVEASVKAARPARIGFGRAQTRYLVKQRRYRDLITGLAPPIDEALEVIRVDAKDGGGVIAYALNLGAHPTTLLGATQKRISGDYPGAISRLLEEKHPNAVALFLQGAVGSVRSTSPRPYENYQGIQNDKFARVAMQADMLLAFVREAEDGMRFEDKLDLSSALVEAALPRADAHFFPEERPYVAARILTIIPNWVFNRLVERVVLPRKTVFQAVRVNHAYLVAFPCDLSNRLGWEVKRRIRRDHVLVLGQSNDYSLGYVLAREEYDMGGISSLGGSERGQDFFGKRAGPFCVEVARRLTDLVKEPGASDVFRYRQGEHPQTVPAAPLR